MDHLHLWRPLLSRGEVHAISFVLRFSLLVVPPLPLLVFICNHCICPVQGLATTQASVTTKPLSSCSMTGDLHSVSSCCIFSSDIRTPESAPRSLMTCLDKFWDFLAECLRNAQIKFRFFFFAKCHIKNLDKKDKNLVWWQRPKQYSNKIWYSEPRSKFIEPRHTRLSWQASSYKY